MPSMDFPCSGFTLPVLFSSYGTLVALPSVRDYEAAFQEGWPLLAVCAWAVSEHRGALCSCALHFGRRNPMRFGPLVSRMQNVQRPSVSLPRAWLPLQM